MKLQVILGSTRPGRVSERIAKWINQEASTLNGIESEIVDLKNYPMPFFDEPVSPRYNQNRNINPDVKKWLDKVNEGDAYIFVTPEYNHSIPGVLKNSIDYITSELTKKPATVAAHGTVGGARATLHLKDILSESGATLITRQLALMGVKDALSEDGVLSNEVKASPYGPATSLMNMLEELKWHSDAMTAARN